MSSLTKVFSVGIEWMEVKPAVGYVTGNLPLTNVSFNNLVYLVESPSKPDKNDVGFPLPGYGQSHNTVVVDQSSGKVWLRSETEESVQICVQVPQQ